MLIHLGFVRIVGCYMLRINGRKRKMKIETRIEIELDADEHMMEWLKKEVKRYLRKVEKLYDNDGVWNVKITPLTFSREEIDWRKSK